MGTIHLTADLQVSPDAGWSVLHGYTRGEDDIFSVVAKVRMEDNIRVVTTVHGDDVREHLICVDPEHRRLSYTIPGWRDGVDFHFATMEILVDDQNRARLRWITDFWPNIEVEGMMPVYTQAFADLVAAVEKGEV